MFDLSVFIMNTIKGMIGNEPDYRIQEYALSWYNRGKLTEDNLAEIEALINKQYEVNEVEDDGDY